MPQWNFLEKNSIYPCIILASMSYCFFMVPNHRVRQQRKGCDVLHLHIWFGGISSVCVCQQKFINQVLCITLCSKCKNYLIVNIYVNAYIEWMKENNNDIIIDACNAKILFPISFVYVIRNSL